MPAQRIELIVPVRTLLVLLGCGVLVVLAVLSLGTLLSIFLATVLALGLDPLVGGLVRRGWGRGRAALVVFAGLFVGVLALVLVAVGPVWEEVESFIRALPGYWEELTSKPGFEDLISTAGADDAVRNALRELAAGLPEAADALLGVASAVFGGVLSLVTLSFLALFLLMERPTITEWLFGFTPPAVEARWRPVIEEAIRAVSSSLVGSAVELSGFTTIVAVLIAGSILGVVGAILAVPFAAVIKIVLREAGAPRRTRMAALRAEEAHAP